MWDRVVEELPRFFTYYNMVFFIKAMFTTFLLSLIGCVLGSVFGGILAVVKLTRSKLLLPLRAEPWSTWNFSGASLFWLHCC